MNNQQPPDLFPDPALRPRPSPPLTRRQRRGVVLIVMAILCIVIGLIYSVSELYAALNQKRDIPMIRPEEGPVKERPAAPGGIEVPHRDVTIFDRIDQKGDSAKPIEHLLPPPEQPNAQAVDAVENTPVITTSPEDAAPPESGKETPPAAVEAEAVPPAPATSVIAPKADAAASPTADMVAKPPAEIPAAPAIDAAPKPMEAKPALPLEDGAQAKPDMLPEKPEKQPETSVPPAVEKLVLPPVEQPVLKEKPAPVAPVKKEVKKPAAAETGRRRIQLAASPSKQKAEEKLLQIVADHANILRGTKLSVMKADLGARGVFYRIQGQPMPAEAAKKLCAEIKAAGAGCLLVK